MGRKKSGGSRLAVPAGQGGAPIEGTPIRAAYSQGGQVKNSLFPVKVSGTRGAYVQLPKGAKNGRINPERQ
jgi:hypothetical protein